MRIIKRQQDLVILRRVGALPATLLDQVEDYFNQLSVELEDEAESQFCLSENGYIVLLKAGDNVHDLGNVGLNHEDGGLLGSCPEYVKPIDTGKGLQACKVAVPYDNDYLMTFLT